MSVSALIELDRAHEVISLLTGYFERTVKCPACRSSNKQFAPEHKAGCATVDIARTLRRFEMNFGAYFLAQRERLISILRHAHTLARVHMGDTDELGELSRELLHEIDAETNGP